MSATVPPAANLDRPSDFGEFYQHAEALARPPSVMPEPEPELPLLLSLTPEQEARRARFRRAVSGIVLGLLAFTALAACVYVVRRAARSDAESSTTPVIAVARPAEQTLVATPPPAAQLPESPALSDLDQVLAMARTPIATLANLEDWSRLASQLSAADRKRVEHDLSRSSVTGAREAQEAARLELALLWRATARRAKAQKVLVSLARTATDPAVKKYALGALTNA